MALMVEYLSDIFLGGGGWKMVPRQVSKSNELECGILALNCRDDGGLGLKNYLLPSTRVLTRKPKLPLNFSKYFKKCPVLFFVDIV